MTTLYAFNEKFKITNTACSSLLLVKAKTFSSEAYDVDMKNITGKFKNIYKTQYFDPHVNSFLSIEPWGYLVFEKIE